MLEEWNVSETYSMVKLHNASLIFKFKLTCKLANTLPIFV